MGLHKVHNGLDFRLGVSFGSTIGLWAGVTAGTSTCNVNQKWNCKSKESANCSHTTTGHLSPQILILKSKLTTVYHTYPHMPVIELSLHYHKQWVVKLGNCAAAQYGVKKLALWHHLVTVLSKGCQTTLQVTKILSVLMWSRERCGILREPPVQLQEQNLTSKTCIPVPVGIDSHAAGTRVGLPGLAPHAVLETSE